MALDLKTGDVVWRKKIADYKAGYSYTAAPLIVNGLVVTGNSGGEFGIIGAVQARDAETGELVWTRPVIEGHMGTLNGEESTMTGTLNATWPGDMWKTGGGATWLGGSYDARNRHADLRRRQPRALELLAARCRPEQRWLGRQPLCRQPYRHRPRHGRDQVALPDHAARRLGL